jgi:peptidoglycan/xylan/chitin deacetylase (PgdA/CDA1 family)
MDLTRAVAAASGSEKARARRGPSPFIRGSVGLHALGAAAVIAHPSSWPWSLALIVANQTLLAGAGLVPRSRLLGPNLSRLPEAAARRGEVVLSFDDGPDAQITPLVLDLLDRHGAKASFFFTGTRAQCHPEVVSEVARRGHSVENHSDRHSNFFACYGAARYRRELSCAQARLAALAGRAPRYFRAPMGLRNPLLEPVLARMGLRLVSWTRRGFDSVSRDPQRVLARLTRGLAAGDILLLHDAGGARTRAGRPVVLEVLPGLLERLRRAGLRSVSLPMACED